MTHTELPWEAVPQPDGRWIIKQPTVHREFAPGLIGSNRPKWIGWVREKADADLIIQAVNRHLPLLEACERALALSAPGECNCDLYDDGEVCPECEYRAALAQAIPGWMGSAATMSNSALGTAAGLTSLVVWPLFDPLREDPRFADLVARMGYPQ